MNKNILLGTNFASYSALIKEQKVISVVSESSFGISFHLDCVDPDNKRFFHSSKDAIFSRHETIFFSRACREEVRNRINVASIKAMESGMFVKEMEEIGSIIFSALFQGVLVSASCINEGRYDTKVVNNQEVSYQDSRDFFHILAGLYLLAAGFLILEIFFHHIVWRMHQKNFLSKNWRINQGKRTDYDEEKETSIIVRYGTP